MSRGEFVICGLCDAPIKASHPRTGILVRLQEMHGLVVEIGYSLGGWGERRNALRFSSEVCAPCYAAVMQSVEELRKVMDAMRAKREAHDADQAPLSLAPAPMEDHR